MKIYLKEKIGNPELFTGRKKEGIKKEILMSTAILSRRKTGKTALLQRLYNLTFEKNDGGIPFYYEVKEGKRWALEFCKDFFLTFIISRMKDAQQEISQTENFHRLFNVHLKNFLDFC